MSRRPTRSSTKKVPNPVFEKLRKIKDGEATHLEMLETKTVDLYEDVDDREYLLRRQRENKFIEDDDGSGYVDHGQMEYNYTDEEEDMVRSKGKKSGDKRKNPSNEAPVQSKGQILNYFQSGNSLGQVKKAKPASSEDVMDDVFSKMDAQIANLSTKTPASSFNSPLPRKSGSATRTTAVVPENPFARLNATLDLSPIPVKKEIFEPERSEELSKELISKVSVIKKEVAVPEIDSDFDLDLDDIAMVPEVDTKPLPEPKWKSEVDMLRAPSETMADEASLPIEMMNDEFLYLYWIDAYVQENTGNVFLMGKMMDPEKRELVSCCVVVSNIKRIVYLLPDPPIASIPDTEEEYKNLIDGVVDEIMPKWTKTYPNQDFLITLAARKYAFDTPADIPKETCYFRLTYPAIGKECAFASGLKGRGFKHVFGANTSALELFLVKHDIMGPCWLQIKGAVPTSGARSHCKLELELELELRPDGVKTKTVSPVPHNEITRLGLEPPPLNIMSVNIKTVLNPKTNANEIAMVNLIVFPKVNLDDDSPANSRPAVRICAIRQLPGTFVPDSVREALLDKKFECEVVQTEQALLNYVLSRIIFYDPDVFVGHSFLEFTLAVLLTRMDALSIPNWARLGRLRRGKLPKSCLSGNQMAAFQQRNLINGRLLCDTYHGAKDTVKSKNYSLGQLCASHLQMEREEIPLDAVTSYYSHEDRLVHIALHGSHDAYLQAALMFKLQLLPLSRQLTVLAGNIWNSTMTGARAKRNEFLLLHEFHRKKYICPDRQQFKNDDTAAEHDQPARRKAAYLGGLVLEPKRGLYDSLVLLLDFNSLYPSIIQEYNICFTTVDRDPSDEEALPQVPSRDAPAGLLPEILKNLIQRRTEVKKLLKEKNITPAKIAELDIRQKALKLTANSMYGCLGYPMSRFYAKQLAMLITAKGREALQSTVELATGENLEIVYGDTDSIMINTHTQDVAVANQLANNFKKKVNQCYSKLEIDIDGIFRRLLLLQKKKYAALLLQERRLPNGSIDYTTTVEAKGLDIVRREFCDLSHNMSEVVLKHILSGGDKDATVQLIYDYLTATAQEIRRGSIPPERFIIYKSISKELAKYADAASQPHVQVALRLQKQQGFAVGKGSTIDYIICCTDDPTKPYAQRAFSADEVSKDSSLQVDYDWYLSRQLLPPITRLCEPIEGITMGQLAESLGLDSSKFNAYQPTAQSESIFDTLMSQEERFHSINKLSVTCVRCPATTTIEKFATVVEETPQLALTCPSCQSALPFQYLLNKIQNELRAQIHRFNLNWMECDEPICRRRTRSISTQCLRTGCEGTMKPCFTSSQLYNHLSFYNQIFDQKSIIASLVKKGISQGTAQSFLSTHRSLWNPISTMIDSYLKLSAQRYVDLGRIFGVKRLIDSQ